MSGLGKTRKSGIFNLDQSNMGKIALIGNALPRRCGIATFTTDIYTALRNRFPETAIDIWAMNDRAEGYDYPAEVVGTIDQDERVSYSIAAQAITASGADMVWLQHEYGIFGGSAGEHILYLLDQIDLPLATHVHTVLSDPDPDQRRVMERLVARSSRLIVMSAMGRDLLISHYGARPEQVAVIPHGIPDRPFVETATMKQRFGFGDRPVVLTFGLLSPGKGIENMIAAMPAIVAQQPDALYVVLGATHPNLVVHEGEAYRKRLIAQTEDLGVAANVRFIDAFVETDELLDYIAAADIYVTPYLNPAQVTSGTLAYAVGLGKVVVSTPYIHARELLADGVGELVPFGDSGGAGDRNFGVARRSCADGGARCADLCTWPHDDLAASGRSIDACFLRTRSPGGYQTANRGHGRPHHRHGGDDAHDRRYRDVPAFAPRRTRPRAWLLYRRQCPRADLGGARDGCRCRKARQMARDLFGIHRWCVERASRHLS